MSQFPHCRFTPQFHPRFFVDVRHNRVFLHSGWENLTIQGTLATRVARLIDGRHTVSEIAAAVEGENSLFEVIWLLTELQERGVVYEKDLLSSDDFTFLRIYSAPDDPLLCAAVVRCPGAYGLGKGLGTEAAFASAHFEALEIECTYLRAAGSVLHSSAESLNGLAIFPNSVQLFSDQQKVPFDPSKVMDWLPVKSSTGKLRFLPKDVALPGCFDLNGVGCGRTTKDAVRHGLLELVERDALAIWWYNRLRRPAVDWRSAQDDYLIRVDTFLRKRGSSFWILDITADLEIPVVVAISSFPLCMGFSAHPNALIAIRNAVAELVQMCLLRDHASELWREPSLIDWWRDIEVENATYLQPNGLVPIATASSGELDSRLQAMGFEIFVLDCTQPQFDRSVVRVFVPGLRPPQPRFADGRLYDVPIQLGDRSEPIREEEMNQPLFPEYLNA